MMARRAKIGRIIRTITFLLCVVITYSGVVSVVGHSNTQVSWIHAYRAKDALQVRRNSLDVIAIGGSPNISGFSPMEAYAEYGFHSFSAGVGLSAGFPCNYLLLEEMLKTQHPAVVLIETWALFGESNTKTGFRVVSDAIGYSKEKLQILEELPEGYFQDSKLSYLFPILKYHTRYKDITQDDFFDAVSQSYYNYFQGFTALYGRMNITNENYPMTESSEMLQADAVQLYYLQKIVDLCKEKGSIPILYKVPWNGNWSEAKYNAVRAFAQANDLDYIDMNLGSIGQAMGFDLYQDFNDAAHVNFWGAVKVTQYLSQFLHENYDLPDRRNDPDYAYLDEELERYKREKFNAKFIQTTDLLNYLDLILDAEDGYTVIISAKDDAFKGLSEELREKMKGLGFQSDLTPENAYRHSLIGVWQDGRLVYENFSEGIDDPQRDLLEFSGSLPDGMKYYVKSAGWYSGNTSSIIINGAERSKNGRGLNIVIYDSRNGRVVDSIVFDTFADAGISYKR